ncbi:MAG: hypothetical protein QNJ73_06545 [Gammaproteobacteria bacterium]|nr:hypothetical protein [Gammaproteobacteria bacterium]
MSQSLKNCRWVDWPERRVGQAQLQRAAALGGMSPRPHVSSAAHSDSRVRAADAGAFAADAEVAGAGSS